MTCPAKGQEHSLGIFPLGIEKGIFPRCLAVLALEKHTQYGKIQHRAEPARSGSERDSTDRISGISAPCDEYDVLEELR